MLRRALLVLTLISATSRAAEVTRVASSFEESDPFGMFLDVTFDRIQESAIITREWYGQDTPGALVRELLFNRYETRMGLDVHLGLYRDVELHVGVPIVFQQDRYWAFADGVNAQNTTLYRNCGDARGNACATPGAGQDRLFTVDPQVGAYRGGLGDFSFGLAWAPYNQRKDPSKPTWVIRFTYTAPTAAQNNPTIATSATARGAIGERIHRYTLLTALSRRIGVAEPYFSVSYTLPWQGPGFYTSCANPSDERLGRKENCGEGPWTRYETGIQPSHVVQVQFGTELTVFRRAERHQRALFDFRADVTYVSAGRYFNELSDPLGKLLTNSDYARVGGELGFLGQAAEFVSLRASVGLGYSTERFLTGEDVGQDLDGTGAVEPVLTPGELNPLFDYRIDRPGRRFRIEEQLTVRIMVTASLNF